MFPGARMCYFFIFPGVRICDVNDPCVNGRCEHREDANGFECICDSGYTGIFCNQGW